MSGIAEFTPEFFDEASRAWRANKVPIGACSFRYKRNAFPLESKKVEPVKTKERMRPRRSSRLAVRLRFMREVAKLKK